ncbi:MAG: hypothetical protein JEY91_09685 [Spirochaetaceae bacterium]|nr:hypothetical protein [Spirochaetaceae bacterium]
MQTKRQILTLLLVLQFLFSFSLFADNGDSGSRSNFLNRIFSPRRFFNKGTQSDLREENLGEVIYFVLPDRFNNGNPYNDYGDYEAGQEDPDSDSEVMKHGLKKDNKAYYHGGDLQGVIEKLPYLKKMGITAIWITPIFKNQPVQGDGTVDGSSSGYHGYWITDFTQIDPHIGTNDTLKLLIEEAHSMDMRVIFDIITNHTADVIKYSDSENNAYRSKEEYPFTDSSGNIFDDLDYADAYTTGQPFPQLDINSFPYTPYIPEGLEDIKKPLWLNDTTLYHNRGNSTFSGENSIYGDFSGLDDLFTAHPTVVAGMIEIYKFWIREFKIDGFRIDTVKHVNMDFWKQFTPEIVDYATEQGIDNFYVFGEVYDGNPASLSRFTTEGKLPNVLDFGFQGAAANFVNNNSNTDSLRDFFAADDYYIDGDSGPYTLPTFVGNHDMGRLGAMIYRDHRENETEEQMLKRLQLAYGLMFTARGNPTIYYGDEQGFTGYNPGSDMEINDQTARQDMFPSQTPVYNDPVINNQLGTDYTPADDNFDTHHPLYRTIQKLSLLKKKFPALSAGSQLHRYSTNAPGGDIFAFSRIMEDENMEHLVALNNNADETKEAQIKTLHKNTFFMRVFPFTYDFRELFVRSDGEGNLDVSVDPLEMKVYRALRPIRRNHHVPEPVITSLTPGYRGGKFWIDAELEYDDFVKVHFYIDEGNGEWELLGTDDNAPYRIQFDSTEVPSSTPVAFKVQVENVRGRRAETVFEGIIVENRMPSVTVHYENSNYRTSQFAINSTGKFYKLQGIDDSGFVFDWQAGADDYTLFYETVLSDGHFEFDRPLKLSLQNDIFPNSREDSNGNLLAEIYVNSLHQVSTTPNDSGVAAETMVFDLIADNPLTREIYIRGGLNGWGTDTPLTYMGNYTFQGQQYISAGDVEFKFADSDWSEYNFGAPFSVDGLTRGSNPGNLLTNFALETDSLYKINFFSYPKGSDGHYSFYRFEKLDGPLEQDIYLNLDGVDGAHRMAYTDDSLYEVDIPLTTGEHSFTIGDLFGAADTSDQWLTIDQTKSIAKNGSLDLKIWVNLEATYKVRLDVSDENDPKLTFITMMDYGPYGAMYLRGGSALSPSEWDANGGNLFSYNENSSTLSFTVTTDSASTDFGDWQFKIADSSWGTQFTGTSGDWLDPANEVLMAVPYSLGQGMQTLFVQPVPGTYLFVIDVSDTDNPVLTVMQE